MQHSQRNFFATSSGSSSAGSAGSTNRKSPPPSSLPLSPPPSRDQGNKKGRKKGIAKVVAENAIVIVALRECFMCVSVINLVQRLGGNPKIIEIEETEKIAMLNKLAKIKGGESRPWELPAVYVGGKLLGGVDKVIEAHIKGEFVPMLRAAEAL